MHTFIFLGNVWGERKKPSFKHTTAYVGGGGYVRQRVKKKHTSFSQGEQKSR